MIAVHFLFLAQNGHPGFIIRCGNIGNQPHFQARTDAFLEDFHVFGRFIRGNDDLFFRAVESFKGVEELFLRAFLADDELDIVDQKDVDAPVFFTEFRHRGIGSVPDGIDQFIRKIFGCHVEHA